MRKHNSQGVTGRWGAERMDRLRLHLARPDPVLLLALLGLLTGLLAGGVIVLFRWLVEGFQSSFLPGGLPENYELLSVPLRWLLPVIGAVAIALIFVPWSRDMPRIRPNSIVKRDRAVTWEVKAFVEATPISGPA